MSRTSSPSARGPRAAALSALASAAALLAGAPVASASPVTWNTGDGANGNTYDVIVNNSISWDAARAAAQASGGDLAVIDSAQEQSFVESVLTTNVAATGSYWIGVREAAEGVWQDANGKGLAYTNWSPGEPDNAAGVENVAAILWTNGATADAAQAARKGRWNDAPTSGYPAAGLTNPPPDALRAGFLVEIPGDDNGGNSGGTDDNGGTDNGGTNAVPLPAAVFAFPVGAGFAGIFYRRMRRGAC
jgi:hypothetical protein